jgi:hypothetical protein
MMQTIKSGDFEISKLCFEDKENSDRFQDEEYDKTAITQRSLKEIDPTKGGHERGKDHSEEKTKITKQVSCYNQTIISPACISTYSKEDNKTSVSRPANKLYFNFCHFK